MAGTKLQLPDQSWDCHLHLLDPIKFPFKPDRTYTPEAATLEALLEASPATNFLIVQASVEDHLSGILWHLRQASASHPNRTFRAEIELHADTILNDGILNDMNELGVRCLRLHGIIGVDNVDPIDYVRGEFIRLGKVAKQMNWSISALCPLETWLTIGDWLMTCEELEGVKIIIEHCGKPDTQQKLDEYPELEEFISLVKRNEGRMFVKLCGINRLSPSPMPDGKIREIPAAVLSIAQALPDSVIWGSDWPHVKFTEGNANGPPVPGKIVDIHHELRLLQSAMSPDAWVKMMDQNPLKLFQ